MKSILTLIPLAVDLFFKSRIEKKSDTLFPRPLLRGLITLEKHHNYGCCLNRAEQYPIFVTAIVSGLLAAFGMIVGIPRRFSHSLILSGSVSNLIDRLIHGYVVDYFRFPIPRRRQIIMNLGDLCIFLGCTLMLWEEWTPTPSPIREEKTPPSPRSEPMD